VRQGLIEVLGVLVQTPSAASARRVFRASLLHLPLFMAALVWHRIPQTKEQRSTQRIVAQLRLGLAAHAPGCTARSGSGEPEAAEKGPGVLGALSVAPFPFLPVPLLQLRCPSRVACEAGGEEGAEVQRELPAKAAA
jgi:protoheme IX farnesyltransferase